MPKFSGVDWKAKWDEIDKQHKEMMKQIDLHAAKRFLSTDFIGIGLMGWQLGAFIASMSIAFTGRTSWFTTAGITLMGFMGIRYVEGFKQRGQVEALIDKMEGEMKKSKVWKGVLWVRKAALKVLCIKVKPKMHCMVDQVAVLCLFFLAATTLIEALASDPVNRFQAVMSGVMVLIAGFLSLVSLHRFYNQGRYDEITAAQKLFGKSPQQAAYDLAIHEGLKQAKAHQQAETFNLPYMGVQAKDDEPFSTEIDPAKLPTMASKNTADEIKATIDEALGQSEPSK